MFSVPVVFAANASFPTAVLLLAVVLVFRALNPMAVLLTPVVFPLRL